SDARLVVTVRRPVKGEAVRETDVEIMNPEVMLFTVESGATVSMELGIGVGRGYESAGHKRQAPAGALVVDAAFSPITRVAYGVEMSRLGKITDYEKLVVEIWTDGSVGPDDALTRASTFLRDHFAPLTTGAPPEDEEAEVASGEAYLREALGKTLEELALPARAINALKGADMQGVPALAQQNA